MDVLLQAKQARRKAAGSDEDEEGDFSDDDYAPRKARFCALLIYPLNILAECLDLGIQT